MNELQTAEAHTILPVERLGDTLVVTPHGDLGGFSRNVFQSEFQRIQTLLDDASLKHLIIDLGGSRYFGSEMIGALVAMREKVIDRGRVVLADVSRDTRAGLDIIQVDGLFEFFKTRRQAVAALATLTIGDRAQRHRRPIRWVLGLLLLACTAWGVYAFQVGYRIFGSRTARVYEELAREWIRYDGQNKRWAPVEARTYREEILDELASIKQSVKQSRLISVKEDYWLEQSVARFQSLLHTESQEDREAFFEYMRYARYYIVARTGLDVPALAPSGPDAEAEEEDVAETANRERRKIEDSLKETAPDGAAEDPEEGAAGEAPASEADQNGDADAA